jgi:regulator of RNase E activity RraB
MLLGPTAGRRLSTSVHTLTVELVRETRARLAALASEHGGLYDGWEASTA